ncbi:hypothetical protein P0L94_00890 [Microbacter sp. GSS18]|nr:hypothetical protein P0L94_00890 [Microbacter sp. GSS18]
MGTRLIVGRRVGAPHRLALYRVSNGNILRRDGAYWVDPARFAATSSAWYDVRPDREADVMQVIGARRLSALDFLNYFTPSTAGLGAPLEVAAVSEVREVEWSDWLTEPPLTRRATHLLAMREPAVEIVPGWFVGNAEKAFSDVAMLDTRNWLRTPPYFGQAVVEIDPAMLGDALSKYDAASVDDHLPATIDIPGGTLARRAIEIHPDAATETWGWRLATAIAMSPRAIRPRVRVVESSHTHPSDEDEDTAALTAGLDAPQVVVVQLIGETDASQPDDENQPASYEQSTRFVSVGVEPGAYTRDDSHPTSWVSELRRSGFEAAASVINESILYSDFEVAGRVVDRMQVLGWDDVYSAEELARQADEYRITLEVTVDPNSMVDAASAALADAVSRTPMPRRQMVANDWDAAWEEALMMCDPDTEELLSSLSVRGLPAPSLAYPVDASKWELEAAWPAHRVAIVSFRSAERDDWLAAEGWWVVGPQPAHLLETDAQQLVVRLSGPPHERPSPPHEVAQRG